MEWLGSTSEGQANDCGRDKVGLGLQGDRGSALWQVDGGTDAAQRVGEGHQRAAMRYSVLPTDVIPFSPDRIVKYAYERDW